MAAVVREARSEIRDQAEGLAESFELRAIQGDGACISKPGSQLYTCAKSDLCPLQCGPSLRSGFRQRAPLRSLPLNASSYFRTLTRSPPHLCKELLRYFARVHKQQLTRRFFGMAFAFVDWAGMNEVNIAGGEPAMKTTLTFLVFCILCCTAAFAQYGSISSEARPLVMASHEQHASEGNLAPQHDLFVRTATAMAQGERPLWEFEQPAKAQPMPLGDVARLYRQQHASAKKAVRVLEK